MTPPPLNALMADDWAEALQPVKPVIDHLGTELMNKPFLPEGPNVLRAFSRPMADVKVLVVGQDPYPTPGHAVGLAFSVDRHVSPIPRSLVNIYTELQTDLGIAPAAHGDLSAWFEQGVLLLNRVLTVAPGSAGSHRGIGWEKVTDQAIKALLERHQTSHQPLAAILWGRSAQEFAPALRAYGVPFVKSTHPSPLSAHHGFFGTRPFSRVNDMLIQQGGQPIDWTVR